MPADPPAPVPPAFASGHHIVEYVKPQKRSDRHTKQQWAALPASITLREVRFTLRVPGFRTTELLLRASYIELLQVVAVGLDEDGRATEARPYNAR